MRSVLDPTARARRRRQAYSSDRPDPLEIFARLGPRTTFRTPRDGGHSDDVLRDQDVAAAVAMARDSRGEQCSLVGKAMAHAIGTHSAVTWADALEHGLEPARALLDAQRNVPGVVRPPHTYRARLLLHDAFILLATPQHAREVLRHGPRTARLRRSSYVAAVTILVAWLENEANTAASGARRALRR